MRIFSLALSLILGSIFSVAARADYPQFPNDTSTRILVKQSDCGVINADSAYYTNFNANGGQGKALIVNASIRNDSFNKTVEVGLTTSPFQHAEAMVSPDWWENAATIRYTSQTSGYDHVTIIDRLVGQENQGSYYIKLTMNNLTFTCTFEIGQ